MSDAAFRAEIEPIAAKYGLRIDSAELGSREDQERVELDFPSSAGDIRIIYQRGTLFSNIDAIIDGDRESFFYENSTGIRIVWLSRASAFERTLEYASDTPLWARIKRRIGTKRLAIEAHEDAFDDAQQAIHEINAVLERYGLAMEGVVKVGKA